MPRANSDYAATDPELTAKQRDAATCQGGERAAMLKWQGPQLKPARPIDRLNRMFQTSA